LTLDFAATLGLVATILSLGKDVRNRWESEWLSSHLPDWRGYASSDGWARRVGTPTSPPPCGGATVDHHGMGSYAMEQGEDIVMATATCTLCSYGRKAVCSRPAA
jgi:hypothetical protein